MSKKQVMSKRDKKANSALDNIIYAQSSAKGNPNKKEPIPITTPLPGKDNQNNYGEHPEYDNDDNNNNNNDDTDTDNENNDNNENDDDESNSSANEHLLENSDDEDDASKEEAEITSFPSAKKKEQPKKENAKDSSKKNKDKDSDEKELPEWRRYWEKEDLYGRYTPTKELGRGSYGVVYEGKSTWDSDKIGIKIGQRIAIKKVRRVFNTDTDAKRLLRELKILRTLRGHQSIVKLFDIIPPIDPAGFRTLTIVFEYVDADLSKIFKTNQHFSSLHVQYMLYHLILGVNYMHSAMIVHRDLKPANVLINADCSIKICDFGLARGFSEDIAKEKLEFKKNRKKKKLQRGLTTHVVTRWYRAPEVILLQQKKEYLTAIDMWSIGCIFAELLEMQKENCPTVWKRGPIFPGDSCFPLSPKKSKNKKNIYQSHMDQIRVIFEKMGTPTDEEIEMLNDEQARAYLKDLPKQKAQNLKELYPGTGDEGISLLTQLLKFDVKERLTVSQCLEHAYFARVRDTDLESAHPRTRFDFEGISVHRKELHELILKETLYYHPEERKRFEKTGIIKPVKNKKVKKRFEKK